MELSDRISKLAISRNREIILEAGLEFGLGVIFTLITFGVMYWLVWIFGFLAHAPFYVPALVTGIFAIVSIYSAWHNINPLADVAPMTDMQYNLTMISLATPGFIYASPEHSIAGLSMFLFGGPANIIKSWPTWRDRLRFDAEIIKQSADVLRRTEDNVPIESVTEPRAVILLHRLTLIKGISLKGHANDAFAVTQKGRDVLHGKDEN